MEGRSVAEHLDVLGGVFFTLQHLLEPFTIFGVDLDVALEYDADADGYYPPSNDVN